MPIYVYESISTKKGSKPKRYEIRQSIKDEALKKHPETGEEIHRVLAGNVGFVTGAKSSSGGHTHSSSCGCGAGGCCR